MHLQLRNFILGFVWAGPCFILVKCDGWRLKQRNQFHKDV